MRILPLDLTEREDLERLEQELRREQPKVYILANAAGFGKIAPAEQVPLEDEAGMIDVNCRALCAVTHPGPSPIWLRAGAFSSLPPRPPSFPSRASPSMRPPSPSC